MTQITIQNQKPVNMYASPFSLLPIIDPIIDADAFEQAIDDTFTTTYIEPIYTPLHANQAVIIEDQVNGSSVKIEPANLKVAIATLWHSPTLDPTLKHEVYEIYRQSMQHHTANDWYFEEQVLVEALTKMKLPLPNKQPGKPLCKYTANNDVIPAAKELLVNYTDATAVMGWFANIGAYIQERPMNNYLIVTVQSSQVFEDIKQTIQNDVTNYKTNHIINRDVNQALTELYKINMAKELSTALFMPNGGGASPIEKQSLSFTRIVMNTIAKYEHQNPNMLTVQPCNLYQVYEPENIIFLNLEQYAHATNTEIKNDWDIIEKALTVKKKLNFITNKKLTTAKSVNQNVNMLSTGARVPQNNTPQRIKVKIFSGKPIPAMDMLARMIKVVTSQITQKQTQNTYTTAKNSYMRPNRRHPDDINMPGKMKNIKYRPDIHLYIDTSGSISENQYRDGVNNLILLAKKINCNIYITSFSHMVSQTTLLQIKDRSVKDIYKSFLLIPKVTGGTDYAEVWNKIDMLDALNQKTGNSHQLNFIISDFEYDVKNGKRFDPNSASVKNTFYVPISVNQGAWTRMINHAETLKRAMYSAGHKNIRNHILL